MVSKQIYSDPSIYGAIGLHLAFIINGMVMKQLDGNGKVGEFDGAIHLGTGCFSVPTHLLHWQC